MILTKSRNSVTQRFNSKNSFGRNSMNTSHHLSSLSEERLSDFLCHLPPTVEIESIRFPSGEVVCLEVKQSRGTTTSYQIFTLHTFYVSGQTETYRYSYLED